MYRKSILILLLALFAMTGQAQEARIDTIVPKFLINGYFFRDMPKLPDATPTMTRLKDKEGNSLVAIGLNVDLAKSVIRQAIPREQVHNADQFLNGVNMMATMQELTQAKVKADGTFYSPKAGEPFPQFSEKDIDGRTWTNDSVRGHAGILLLGQSYEDEYLVGALRAVLLRQRCSDLLQLGLEAVGELVVHAVLFGGLRLGAHPVEGVGGGSGQLAVLVRLEIHLHALYLYRLVELVLQVLHRLAIDGLVSLTAGARHAQELVVALPEQVEVLLRGD